jgi:rRNA processing protein Krr1/Pno1
MPKEYKYEDKSKKRERSRSHSINRNRRSNDRNIGNSILRRDRKKVSKWSDAPPENSKFSDTMNDKDMGSTFESNININSHSNQVSLQQQVAYPMKSKVNPLNFLDDNTKLKKKIYIPKSSEINYVGLLIGPKGTYQKRLEQQTGCKILIRGKGTQKEGNPPQPDDHEEKHVLIIGDSEDKLGRAQMLIERVLYADEKTRNKIKEEQIKASQEIRSELLMQGGEPISQIEEFMLTPYGPPDKNARIVPVPNDCVGLIIGKNGETIRRLNRESGCKVQIAIKPIPNTEVRNVFIEGPPEKYEIAKKLIEEIVSEQISLKEKNPFFQLNLINSLSNNSGDSSVGQINPFPGPHTPLRIPNKMVGLIIGRNGETVKNIHDKTRCYIFIPKESRPGEDFRELQLSGPPGSVELCKREIISMIHLALYGRLPYMNSLFYPFLDPVTGLPIIDPNTLSQLDPNTKIVNESYQHPHNAQTEIKDSSSQEYEQKTSTSGYDLYDYDNPMNYDLYFQSLYQMYPHMNDYFKQGNQNVSNPQYIICNNGLMDENRAMYDPNYIVQMFNQMMDNNKLQDNELNQEISSQNEADYSKYIEMFK